MWNHITRWDGLPGRRGALSRQLRSGQTLRRGNHWTKIHRQLFIRSRHGCGSDIPELRPAGTDFDLPVVPLYLRSSSVASNMETPYRIRHSRRNRSRCGHVAAKWCLHGRSQISTQRSTLPRSWSAPTQPRPRCLLHPLLEFLSRSCQLGLYSSGWYSENLCGFPSRKTVHISELEGSKQSRRKLRHQLPHVPSQFAISKLLLWIGSGACQ